MTFNEYYKPYNEQLELSWSQKKRIELYEFIFEPKTYFSKICSLLISIVIILAIICSCLETLKRFRGMLIWKIIEFSSSLVFLIEYILKLGAVTNRNKYIRTSCHFIDFVSMIPLFFVFVSEDNVSDIVSFLKLLKLIRIIKVLSNKSMSVYTSLMIETMSKSIHGFKLMAVLIIIVMIFSASVIYEIEKGVRLDGSEPFSSIPTTFYWSIVTITTVGYGDIYPITNLGRLMSSLTMVIGLIVIALPITIISKNFSRTWDEFENRGLIKVRDKCFLRVKPTNTSYLKLLLHSHCIRIRNLNELSEIERSLVQSLSNQILDNLDMISKIISIYISSERMIEIESDGGGIIM